MEARLSTSSPEPKSASEATQGTVNIGSIGLILLSVLLAGIGQLTFKGALNQIGQLQFSVEMLVKLVTNPLMLLGLGIFGGSALLWLIALMKAELSFAYPFLSLTYIIVLFGGALLFQEQITLARIAGFGLIIAGILVIARGETQSSGPADR